MAKRKRRLGLSAGLGKHRPRRMTTQAIAVELHYSLIDHEVISQRDCSLMKELLRRHDVEQKRERLNKWKVKALAAMLEHKPFPSKKVKLLTKLKRVVYKLTPKERRELYYHVSKLYMERIKRQTSRRIRVQLSS